ncbi:hypothetical protein [Burkholderia cepacia]|uniref:hypothetical protein n=1 Tax=Burkholderia cepacia TaxID=292 RepID=UPI003A5C0D14
MREAFTSAVAYIEPSSTPRSAPRILYSGRIEASNDAVKQGTLAARAIGRALRHLAEDVHDASVDIYGFGPDPALIDEFRELLEREAGYRIADPEQSAKILESGRSVKHV